MSDKKNILVISPWVGRIGPNTFLEGFCSNSLESGLNVTVLYPHKDFLAMKLSQMGCEIIYVNCLKLNHITNLYWKYVYRFVTELICLLSFFVVIPRRKYSFCIVNTEVLSFSLIFLSLFVKISIVVHSLSFEAAGWMTSLVFRLQGSFVSNYIAVSCAVSKSLKAQGVTKPIHVVYNGLNTISYNCEKPLERRSVVRVLSVIHPLRHKGAHHLLNVVKYIVSRDRNVEFSVVGWSNTNGDVDYKLEIESTVRAAGLSKFIRFKPVSENIQSEYADADIYLHPSESESFGYVLIEAMVKKLPVIAFSVGGIPEIVQDGKSGYLIDSFNIIDMGEALETLINDHDQRKKFGDTGSRIVKEKFELKENMNLMLQILKNEQL